MFDPLISTVSMNISQPEPSSVGVISAVLTIAPSIVTGHPPEYWNGAKSLRKGTAPAFVSNSETRRSWDTICRTVPIVDIASALRCIEQNQSYLSASSPSSQTALPAMKKGLLRKSSVSLYTSSHVPRMASRSAGLSAPTDSISTTDRNMAAVVAAVAVSPRLQLAARPRMDIFVLRSFALASTSAYSFSSSSRGAGGAEFSSTGDATGGSRAVSPLV
mmetsp:Transcript_42363/g.83222  ORF Transcript_42363/g.83222 Transcript_42363/m.83222 type:complete len:218 (+) Transcript_42363:354-1007(+)